MTNILSTQMLVQNVVLALMFVLLKQFIRDNIQSSIYDNEFRLLQLEWPFLLYIFCSGIHRKIKIKAISNFTLKQPL